MFCDEPALEEAAVAALQPDLVVVDDDAVLEATVS